MKIYLLIFLATLGAIEVVASNPKPSKKRADRCYGAEEVLDLTVLATLAVGNTASPSPVLVTAELPDPAVKLTRRKRLVSKGLPASFLVTSLEEPALVARDRKEPVNLPGLYRQRRKYGNPLPTSLFAVEPEMLELVKSPL